MMRSSDNARDMRACELHRTRDLLEGKLGFAVCGEEPVHFLERVAELRVTEAAEQRRHDHGLEKLVEKLRELLPAADSGITPAGRISLRACVGNECDAAELSEHDRLAAMRVTVQ